jgi:hypothetical protein
MYSLLAIVSILAVLVGLLGLLLDSLVVVLLALILLVEYPACMVIAIKRMRMQHAERFGPSWFATFSQSGVRVDGALLSTTYAWAYWAAWTVYAGNLLLIHPGHAPTFVALPITLVPEDEWQPLTTLLYEKVGPARTPSSVRGSRLTRAGSPRLGEAAHVHPGQL